jgi:alpha,alpha-trehalase
MLANAYEQNNEETKAKKFRELAIKRKAAINKYCWSAKDGWYEDYSLVTKKHTGQLTLAGLSPFFLQVAEPSKIFTVAANVQRKFLKAGGLTTTLKNTGEQWDAPNGWAPLEWISISGLENYGQTNLAKIIAQRWISLNNNVFKRTGKLMEKYNVMDLHLEAGGGEYPSQDGFGWTNGVLLALIKKYGNP